MKKKEGRVSEHRKGRWKALVLALFLLIMEIQNKMICYASENAEEKTGVLYARSAVLMDAETGRVLLEKEGDVARPMASTTKIITCILALEEGWQDDIVSVSALAASQPKVHAGIQENEQYWLEDLLYSLMLESHNDSAVAIAEHIGGSVEEFAEMMNQKAEEIGCTTAHFITPNGLDESDENGVHSISAEDLAKIMSYCVTKSPKAEKFLEITQTRSYSFQEITGKRVISCTNHNSLLDMVEGAISGKTGFTGDAGYCYVGAVERDGRVFVVALLACGWPNNKNYKWSDSKQLLSYGIENYVYEDVWTKLEKTSILVEEGISEEESLFCDGYVEIEVENEENSLKILKSPEEKVIVDVQMSEKIEAPVEQGDLVGTITYYIEGEKCQKYDIVAADSMERKDYLWTIKKLIALYINQ